MESIIATFHIDWKVIIAQAINFSIVFAVLYVYALKPLGKLMDERKERIDQGLKDAKKNEEVLEDTKAKYEEALAQARAEANKIFEAGKKEAEGKKNEMLAEAEERVAGMVAEGKKTLEADKARMVAEAKKEISDLAISIARKLLNSDKHAFDQKVLDEIKNS